MILFGIPVYPVPSVEGQKGAIETGFPEKSEIVGIETRMTNIDAVSRRTGRLLRRCRQEVKARTFSALLELLDEEPWFIYHPWVEKAFDRFRGHPRLRRKKRGRPPHGYKINPEALFGLVESLIRSGRVKNRDRAFGLIDEWCLLSYKSAKQLYRRVQTDKNPRGVFIEFPDEAVYVTADEARPERAMTEELGPNTSARRTFQHSESGPIEFVLKTGEPGSATHDFAIIKSTSVRVQKDR